MTYQQLQSLQSNVNNNDDLEVIFGRIKKNIAPIREAIIESKKALDKLFCEKHTAFKRDILNNGELDCEKCFYEEESCQKH